jgi:NCAIR mutase (PurE)-related protein
MAPSDLRHILEELRDGRLGVEEAASRIRTSGFADLGFARLDLLRPRRKGFPEVIFCEGKEPDQVVEILGELLQHAPNVLATRADPALYDTVRSRFPEATYAAPARVFRIEREPMPRTCGHVVVVSAGTADIPVAEEAALTLETLGTRTTRLFDVGVAGIHRLLAHTELIRGANAVVVAAGMEGALPSVVGGLTDRPVIAVPTAVGYGAHLGGLTPLLAMLNSCVPGVVVVNIGNGFGAGYAAALVNRLAAADPAGNPA